MPIIPPLYPYYIPLYPHISPYIPKVRHVLKPPVQTQPFHGDIMGISWASPGIPHLDLRVTPRYPQSSSLWDFGMRIIHMFVATIFRWSFLIPISCPNLDFRLLMAIDDGFPNMNHRLLYPEILWSGLSQSLHPSKHQVRPGVLVNLFAVPRRCLSGFLRENKLLYHHFPLVDIIERVWNSFRFFFWAGLGFFLGFLGWYHLPSVCNSLELEFVILHGICHIWACSPSILHGIYYMWACSPSILYGICHILAFSPSILHGISYMWACSPSYLPHFSMFTFHFAWDVLHVSMFTQIFTDAEAWD